MRLLVICAHYPPMLAPEGVHARMLCQHLSQKGIETHLLTSVLPGAAAAPGFTLHAEMPEWTWRARRQFVSTFQRINPDAVLLIYVGWVYGDHPMITFAPSYLRRINPRARFIAQFENVMGAKLETMKRRLAWTVVATRYGVRNVSIAYGSLLRDSAAVIALSDLHLKEILKAFPGAASKSSVIAAPPLLQIVPDPDGTVKKRGRQMLGINNGEAFVFAYFGHIYPGKGVEHLLPAFAEVRDKLAATQQRRPRLVLIGKGDPALEENLRSQARELKIEQDLSWTGHCEAAEPFGSTYLRAADVAVLPFDQGLRLNNSSFSVCIAHGLPVVSTRTEAMEPEFLDGQNVLFCPAREPRALAQAMLQTASSPELRAHLSRGAAQLSQSFSWERNVESTLAVLRS